MLHFWTMTKKMHRSCLLCRDWKKAVLGLIWGPWIYSEAGAANNLVIPVMSEIWKKQCHVTNTIRIKFGPELVLFWLDPLRSCRRFWSWVIGPYSTSSQTRTRMCILIAELLFYFTVFFIIIVGKQTSTHYWKVDPRICQSRSALCSGLQKICRIILLLISSSQHKHKHHIKLGFTIYSSMSSQQYNYNYKCNSGIKILLHRATCLNMKSPHLKRKKYALYL